MTSAYFRTMSSVKFSEALQLRSFTIVHQSTALRTCKRLNKLRKLVSGSINLRERSKNPRWLPVKSKITSYPTK